ncbi:hypothetical protein Cgig2_016502 [Carnegiea gigantea]|uniref:Uncharacterized protein n=1 Tax=Carnegiea gigantea TaxID=171969 RepID=A0A9Q1GU03_9CARY|nr:hypothetical protein Cgig2_016502 [Carnegiea gigantea]
MAASLPLVSPPSDKRFWSTLRNRVDTLLETRNSDLPSSISPFNDQGSNRAKRMKEDSMLLIRGFDSIAYSLSQLTSTLDNALQGARDLAKAPTLTELVQSSSSNTQTVKDKEVVESGRAEHNGGQREKVKKRKLDVHECSKNDVVEETDKENQAEKNLKKVKGLAVSMAAKSASLARELKSIKSDLCFLQEQCTLLEEENRRLRDGFGKDIRPDEDDLVRLQLEALLAEKSRLATENAHLTRENQCLRQIVEYHQFTSQDLSASYEQVIQGLCLDFSSPVAEQECGFGDPETPKTRGSFEFGTDFDGSFAEEQEQLFKD